MTTVSGILRDTQKNPLPGLDVTVRYTKPLAGWDDGAAVQTDRFFETDLNGLLTMDDLVPGHYQFVVFVPSNQATTLTVPREATMTVQDVPTMTLEEAIDEPFFISLKASAAIGAAAQAAASANRSQAWAESPTPPDPDDATSKSSKIWAGESADSAVTSTTQAGISTTQAGIATTQADIAVGAVAQVDSQRAVGLLADARGQSAGATAKINQTHLAALLARIEALENERDAQMTTYSLSLTAGTTSQVAVAAGPVQRLQLLNKSATETVGVAFGSAPANMAAAGLITLAPGSALDTTLIQTTPVHVIATGGAEVVGAFAVPLNEPNPNFETDLQALIARMGSTPSLLWQRAYRRLYSALRRDGILSRTRGFYPLAAHAEAAALINWAEDNAATIVSEPVFTAGQGFAFDGTDDYLNTGRSLGTWSNYGDVAAMVWPDETIQGLGPSAMGDGSYELNPNRTTTQASIRGWHIASGLDVINHTPGTVLGAMRIRDPDFTAFRQGGNDLLVGRVNEGATMPTRATYIGARNTGGGVAGFYTGTVRAAWLGRSLNSVQRLALETAMDQYFKDAADAVAGD